MTMRSSVCLLVLAPLLALAETAPDAPHPRSYQVRLMGPLGSESREGSGFLGRIVGPLGKHRPGELPRNTLIRGRVRKARPVGLGIRREQAILELQFDGCALPTGNPVDCQVQLVEIDNARERVTRPNTLQGIVAASHPHSWISGLWLRPTPALFGRSTVGLTGASGMLQARFLANPLAAAGIVGARAILFRLPDPEIQLPTGTDLILKITAPPVPGVEPRSNFPRMLPDLPGETADILQTTASDIVPVDGPKVADLINFAFLGSRQQLEQAFAAAGWTAAKPFNARTFAHTYKAFASMNTYKAAPVSPLTWEGRLPDLVYQKSFNTLSKRHHIRIWNLNSSNGEELWIGAATHDIGVAFDWGRLSLTHRVDLRIDRERNILLNDLNDADCMEGMQWLDRPALQSRSRSGNAMRITDGGMAVVKLHGCIGPDLPAWTQKKPNVARLFARRIVLETRHYITRGNPYYYAFRAVRWSAFRKVPPPGDDQ